MKFMLSASVLVLCLSTFSYAHAQDHAEEIEAAHAPQAKVMSPNAGEHKAMKKAPEALVKKEDNLDPVSGTVPLSDTPFYDFYERRIRYKTADKEFRNSIEARRASFEAPNSEHSNAAKAKITKIYKKESEESLKAQQKKNGKTENKVAMISPEEPEDVKSAPVDNRPVVPTGEPGDGMDHAPETLKEQEEIAKQSSPTIPPEKMGTEVKVVGVKEIDVEETPLPGVPDKKIVVPEDAPDFQNSPL